MSDGVIEVGTGAKANAAVLRELDSRRVELTLPFRLSYWTIARKRLRLDRAEYDFGWILEHAQGFDTRELPLTHDPDADGSLYRSLPVREWPERVQRGDGHIVYVTETYDRFYADLSLGADGYAQTFSSKSRSTLRRKVRKWAKECGGELDWREYRTAEELAEFHSLARAISEKTYQENLLDAGLPADDTFRHQMLDQAEQGAVYGYLLFDGEQQAVAYLYCPVHDGIVTYQYLGYLADHPLTGMSPGAILLWLALEKMQADPALRWFDFTEGSDQGGTGQKARFGTGSVRCADVWVLRRRVSIVLLLGLHRFVDDFSESIGRMLERLGVKQRVKRWIRTRQS